MRRATATARLYLDGEDVGTVRVRGWESSWGFGDFEPNERFSPFAPLFGQWSLLMHEESGHGRMGPALSAELRRAEAELDRLRARLYVESERAWYEVGQLNIDGALIEWKEGWGA